MLRIAAAGPTCKMIDLSHYESADRSKFDPWAKEHLAAGCLKITEGDRKLDATYTGFDTMLDQLGIPHGAYHFFHPAIDGAKQADFFVNALGTSNPDFVCIDWETTDGVAAKADRANGRAFIDRLKQRLGPSKKIVEYGGPYFFQDLSLDDSFGIDILWLAEYGGSAPLVPAPWKRWDFWQYTDKESVPGIGPCDMSLFNGAPADLKKLLGCP